VGWTLVSRKSRNREGREKKAKKKKPRGMAASKKKIDGYVFYASRERDSNRGNERTEERGGCRKGKTKECPKPLFCLRMGSGTVKEKERTKRNPIKIGSSERILRKHLVWI